MKKEKSEEEAIVPEEDGEDTTVGNDEEFDLRFRDSPWLPFHLENLPHPSYKVKENREDLGPKATCWFDSPWRELHEEEKEYPYESEVQRLKRMAAEPGLFKPVCFDAYDIDALLADRRVPSMAEKKDEAARRGTSGLVAETTKVWNEECAGLVKYRNYSESDSINL